MGWVCTLALVSGLGTPPAAWADCPPEWLPGEGVPGVDGHVCAMTTWDPDGPGGQPELLVMGGRFTVAGDAVASNIAAWNGTSWQPLGSGMNDGVSALTVYNGELIAGGDFTTAGGDPASRIARWNGTIWQPLGSGVAGLFPHVWALAVYNGELIAGGWFTTAGGIPAKGHCVAHEAANVVWEGPQRLWLAAVQRPAYWRFATECANRLRGSTEERAWSTTTRIRTGTGGRGACPSCPWTDASTS